MASPRKRRMRRLLILQRLQDQQEPIAVPAEELIVTEVAAEESIAAPKDRQEIETSKDKPASRSWDKKEKKKNKK